MRKAGHKYSVFTGKILPAVLKIVLWTLGGTLTLLLLAMLSLRVPVVREYLSATISRYLSNKLGTVVRVQRFDLGFPRLVSVHGIYCETPSGDTLAYFSSVSADVDLASLLHRSVKVTYAEIRGGTAYVRRLVPDSTFNFQFIVAAFSDSAASPEPADTAAVGWDFSIEEVLASEVRFLYRDDDEGIEASGQVGKLFFGFNEFNLEGSRLVVSELLLEDSRVAVCQREPAGSADTSESGSSPWVVGAQRLHLARTFATYNDLTDSSFYSAAVGELQLDDGFVNLNRSLVTAKKLVADNLAAEVFLPDEQIPDVVTETAGGDSAVSWQIDLEELSLERSTVHFRQGEKPSPDTGFDPSYLRVHGLSLRARDFKMAGEDLRLQLDHLGFLEKKGFELKKLAAFIHYHPYGAEVEDLYLETPRSLVRDRILVSYPSLEAVASDLSSLQLNAHLSGTKIGWKDVLYFMPSLSSSLALRAGDQVLLDAEIAGNLRDLKMNLRAGWRSSRLRAEGHALDILDTSRAFVRLDTITLYSSRNDLAALLPPGSLPSGMQLPDSLSLRGNFNGYFRNFNASVDLKSNFGSAQTIVRMDPKAGNMPVPYRAEARASTLQLGRLLGQPDLGALTASVSVAGSGLDTSSFDTKVTMHVQQLIYRGYNYTDLVLDGHLLKSAFTGTSRMRDDNLAFDFDGHVNIDKTAPKFRFSLDLKGADLHALHLAEDDTRVSGRLQANLAVPSGSNPVGTAALYDVVVLKEGTRYMLDSLALQSLVLPDRTVMELRSEKLEAKMEGRFRLSSLMPSLLEYVNGHFRFDDSDTAKHLPPQQFELSLKVVDPSFLSAGLVPGLERLTPLQVFADFNSAEQRLNLRADVPSVNYSGITMDSLKVRIKGSRSKLLAGIMLGQLSDSLNFDFRNVEVDAAAGRDSIRFLLGTSHGNAEKVLSVSGVLLGGDSAFTLRIAPRLVIGSSRWRVDSNNTVRFGGQPFSVSALTFSGGGQHLRIWQPAGAGGPLAAEFRAFDLSTVSSMLSHDVPLAKGRVNGELLVETENDFLAFRSDLKLDSFVYRGVPVGNISLKADNYASASDYEIELEVHGAGNDLAARGTYHTASRGKQLDVLFDMRALQLASIEPFTAGQLTRMGGSLSGRLKITGRVASPVIEGTVFMHEVAMRPAIIDSYLRIPGGEMTFGDRKLRFQNVPILDSLGNKASLNGSVDLKNITDPAFDLRLRTENFLAMNTDKRDNDLYFGQIFLDSDVQVTGTPARPTIEVKARLNKRSHITYIKPEDEILKEESRGIVEFTDTLGKYARIMTRTDSNAVTGIEGLQLIADITVDREVDLKVIVDPLAGDSLYIRGGGRLNFTMERSGSTALTGKYNITKGGYFLTISDFVKRDFRIAEGSSVTWSGDPLDAYVDLSAAYRVKAAPIDLIQDQAVGLTDQEAGRYRNLLTFDVYLKMQGFVSSPNISFDIQLAPEDRGALGGAVSTRLAELRQDENQLNKQVFALLTMRRFVGENPLEGSGGGGLSSAGRSSASKVLTTQLNTLSDRYVNFVDLDLGVNSYEDYSSGTQQGRTQVQVGVSKQLFDDRVTVRVGGNVDIEGEKASENDMNDVAGNLSIDYKLTQDGRYRIKAFRENQYENPIEGEITRTGAAFVFSRDFNRFKNLFRKPRSRRNESTASK